VEGDRRALVIGSGYASTKHAETPRYLLAAVYARLFGDGQPSAAPLARFEDGLRHARFAAAARESASRERWVSVS